MRACTRARRSPAGSGLTCWTRARARACAPSWSPFVARSARPARASSWRRATWSGSWATASSWTPGSSSGWCGRGGWTRPSICATGSCCRDSTPSGSTRPASPTASAWVTCSRASPRTPRRPARWRTRFASRVAASQLDPLREDAHRELIRRLIAAGEISAARVAFDDLARRLRTELHVAPSRETRRLLEAIHAHEVLPRRSRPRRRRRHRRRSRGGSAAGSSVARTRCSGSGPVVGGPGRVGPARPDRRRAGHRQDAAGRASSPAPRTRTARRCSSAAATRRR